MKSNRYLYRNETQTIFVNFILSKFVFQHYFHSYFCHLVLRFLDCLEILVVSLGGLIKPVSLCRERTAGVTLVWQLADIFEQELPSIFWRGTDENEYFVHFWGSIQIFTEQDSLPNTMLVIAILEGEMCLQSLILRVHLLKFMTL